MSCKVLPTDSPKFLASLRVCGLEKWKLEFYIVIRDERINQVVDCPYTTLYAFGTLADAQNIAKGLEKSFNLPEGYKHHGSTLISYRLKPLSFLEGIKEHIKYFGFKYPDGWRGVCFVNCNPAPGEEEVTMCERNL